MNNIILSVLLWQYDVFHVKNNILVEKKRKNNIPNWNKKYSYILDILFFKPQLYLK